MNNRIAYMLFYLKSIIMKAKGRNLFTLITILFSTLGYSQQLVAEVEYIKLEPGKWKEFSELRKDVLIPYNQGRMDAGMIVGWGLYERMHTGADDPYTHIIVSIYDDYLKTENSVNWEWINENFSEEEVAAMMERFREKGILITEVYFCPHHPELTGECECRKPKPGMILKAINKYNIDPKKSVLIGDKESDIQAGINAHIGRNIYIQDLLIE